MSVKPSYSELEQRIRDLEKVESELIKTSEALRESESRFRLLYERAPVGYQSLDIDGNFIEVNQAWLDTLGYDRNEVIGKNFADFLHPDWAEHFRHNFPRFKAVGEILGVEFQMVKKDGSMIFVSFNGKIGKDKSGNFQQTHCVLHDITEAKKKERALIESEEKFRRIFQRHAAVKFLIDPATGSIVEANDAAASFYGWSVEDLKTMKIWDINTLASEQVKSKMMEAMTNGREYSEFQHRLADGSVRDVAVYISKIDIDGKPMLHSIIHDTTARKQAEKELQETSAILKAAMDCSAAGIAIADAPSGKLRYVNHAGLAIRRGKQEEVVNNVGIQEYVQSWQILHFDGTPYQPHEVPLARAIMYGEKCSEQFIIRRPGNEDRVVWANAAPVYDYKGEVIAGIVVFPDITEFKKTEKELRKSEELLSEMTRQIPGVLYQFYARRDGTRGFYYISERSESVVGLKPDLDGFLERFAEMVIPEHREGFIQSIDESVNEIAPWHYEGMLQKPTGERIWFSGDSFPSVREEEVVFNGIVQDISDRKQAEETLRQKDAMLANFASQVPGMLYQFTMKPDGGFSVPYSSDGVIDIFGCSPEDVKNDFGPILDAIHPEDRDLILKTIDASARNMSQWKCEYRVQIAGEPVKWIFGNSIPEELDDGAIVWSGYNVDITESKLAEEKRQNLELRLQRAQKMEAIGNLAGGIAHDFNNILFPIVGLSEMLLEDLPPDSFDHERTREILNAGERGVDLVKQILSFSRQTEQKKMPIRIQQIVNEALKLCRSTIPANIQISWDIENNCPMVMADPTQIHQIAMNLITNAFHAVESKDGEIFVNLKETALEADDLPNKDLMPGRYALLSVSDTGVGIDPAIVDKIFEPYFTTKKQGKGTGLGLAVAYGIVKDHHGDISVYSENEKGTTFNVYLPIMEETEKSVVGHKEALLTGSERILLVDDEKVIVNVEKQMLERLGYHVTEHYSSSDALKAFEMNPSAFDLVISDLSMPNMTGFQLARELLEIRPDIPIIMCTGFSEQFGHEKADSIGVKGLLMKPVVKAEMASMIRKVLDDG